MKPIPIKPYFLSLSFVIVSVVSGCFHANQGKTESPSNSEPIISEGPEEPRTYAVPDQKETKVRGRTQPVEEDSDDDASLNEEQEGDNLSGCRYSDGSHSATVTYHNPDPGFENDYSLAVVVEDCQVIEIDFPKGGWLDDTHINPEDLDEDGEAQLTDDRGHEWTVQIDD